MVAVRQVSDATQYWCEKWKKYPSPHKMRLQAVIFIGHKNLTQGQFFSVRTGENSPRQCGSLKAIVTQVLTEF